MFNNNQLPQPTINADLVIETRWIATAASDRRLLENYAVIVQAGLISAILPIAEARQQYTASSLVC